MKDFYTDITKIENSEWYNNLVDDCKAIITEAVFNSRWALVEGYHQLGERIANDKQLKKWNARGNGRTLQHVAKSIRVSERTVYYAVQFYEKYPLLDEVPEGKNITWRKLVNYYLPSPAEPDNDPEPDLELLKKWKVKTGQVWRLGDHMLVCGDCYTMQFNEATSLITDPPYGINYKADWKKWDKSPSYFKAVHGDDQAFDPSPFLDYDNVVLFGADNFSDRLPVGSWICWDKRLDENKDAMIGAPFELAWFKSANTTKRAIMIRVLHGGVVNADSEEGNNAKRQHTTQKPVEVMQRIIEAVTLPSDIVYDPFSGSGSTLLACEITKRQCIAVEIDPEYIAVTLERWEQKKGITPCLE